MFKDTPFNTDCSNFVSKTQDISSYRGIATSFICDSLVLLQIKLTLTPKFVITQR